MRNTEEINILSWKGKKSKANKTVRAKQIKDYNAAKKLVLFQVIPRPKLEPKGSKLQKLSMGKSTIAKTSATQNLLKLSSLCP